MTATGNVRSMTGYGDSRGQFGGGEVVLELWSVNHRYFDFTMNVPDGLQALEVPLKKQVAARLPRGRVRLALRLTSGEEQTVKLALSEPKARAFAQFHADLKARHG